MHLRGLGQFDLGSMISAKSLIKSGLQYAANALIMTGVGTVIGLAITVMTFIVEWGDPYKSNFYVSWKIATDGAVTRGYTQSPEGVTNELDPVIKAVQDALQTYARSADDLGFLRLPFSLTVANDATYVVHEMVNDNFVSRFTGPDYAAGIFRAILDPLLASFSVYPGVEAIRAATPSPDSLSAEQCKAVLVAMYEARTNDVIAVVEASIIDAGALDKFRAQAEASAAGAAARFQACQEAKRAALLAMTAADAGFFTSADYGGYEPGSAMGDFQAMRNAGQFPAYKAEPWSVQMVGGGGFDLLTGQEGGAATPVIVTGAQAQQAAAEAYDPFWWQAGSN